MSQKHNAMVVVANKSSAIVTGKLTYRLGENRFVALSAMLGVHRCSWVHLRSLGCSRVRRSRRLSRTRICRQQMFSC